MFDTQDTRPISSPSMSFSLYVPGFSPSSHTDDAKGAGERDNSKPTMESIQRSRVIFKSSGACVHCKSLKVRCHFDPGEKVCQRCQAGNYQCLARDRKKRKPAPTHEDLQAKAYSQDRQIQALLLRFDQMRTDQKIKEWVSRASSDSVSKASHAGSEPYLEKPRRNQRESVAERAVLSHFSAGQNFHVSTSTPDIVKHCGLYPEEIRNLFDIFFERINPFFSILDPQLHTPENLIWTCPFLFTVICAIASRYYYARPGLYDLAKDFSRDAAGRALVDGSKSVDVCQAYLLMAVYPVPKKKWAEDRSWLLMGVAIRMATELELNQPPPDTCDERERLNRTRTWLNCYCVDGSHAIQFGKLPMLRLDDYLARYSRDWYKSSRENIPFDIHLCAYVQIIILMAKWRSLLEGDLQQRLRDGFDVVAAAIQTQETLSKEMDHWVEAYAEEFTYTPLPICEYRGNTTQMIAAYLRLVVLVVGFQHTVKTGILRDSTILLKSIDAALCVIQIMVERLYPTGNLRYAMEANFVYVSFAAAFLVNLLRRKFLPLLDEMQRQEIILVVNRLIDILGSREVALDGRHTPALYSRFLSSLLERHNVRLTSALPTDTQEVEEHQPTPPMYSWPDVSPRDVAPLGSDYSEGAIYQQHGEADMDFSLTHFVRTVSQDHTGPPVLAYNTPQENGPGWPVWSVRGDTWSSSQFSDAWR